MTTTGASGLAAPSGLGYAGSPVKEEKKQAGLLQLLIGAGGIYACFLYYGSLQEDVFRWKSSDGTKIHIRVVVAGL